MVTPSGFRRAFFCVATIRGLIAVLPLSMAAGNLNAAEWSLDSGVRTYYEYNDNLFLTTLPHESVSKLVLQPDLKFRAVEKNWETKLQARLNSNHYSEPNLDSNDQYYLMDGSYRRERDTFSIKGVYDLDSSLDTDSADFGISGERVNRTTTSVSPSYSRMLSERLQATLSYSLIETKYDDTTNTGFVPYKADVGSVSMAYNLTQRDKLSGIVQYTDYASLNGLSEYQMLIMRVGLSRQLSEVLSVDLMVGTSERDTINRFTNSFDFFGTTVTQTQESNFDNSGLILDAGFNYSTEVASLAGRLSRDNVTSSYGGVDEVDKFSLVYNRSLSSRWSYKLDGQYDETRSDITSTSFRDYNLLKLKAEISHYLDRNWRISASYRYMKREFVTQYQNGVPDSNTLYIGMTYNYSKLATF